MKEKLRATAILIFILVLLGAISLNEYESRRDLIFSEALDKVILTVDGEEMVLRDLAFYIAYKENDMEKLAKIYNSEDTDEYWNVRTNDTFLREEAKQSVIQMAVHDEIFYRLAIEEGMELSAEEEEHLANDQYDFWSDLEEEQREALAVDETVVKEAMRKVAIAEKYQYLLAEMEQKEFDAYSPFGEEYKKMLEEHTYTVEESVWDRIRFGGVTLDH